MRLLHCPKEEKLLQWLSIRQDLSLSSRVGTRVHLRTCRTCREKAAGIKSRLELAFSPQPDIASSLIRVYQRLQQDETLILKGWKIGELSAHPRRSRNWLASGWLFRGAVAMGLGSIAVIFVMADRGAIGGSPTQVARNRSEIPFAQIRFEDKNRVQVHYIKPELVQSVEFETTGAR